MTVAVLTTPVARHEVYMRSRRYYIITTRPESEPTDLMRQQYGRELSREQAMEWCEMAKAGGGEVRLHVSHV